MKLVKAIQPRDELDLHCESYLSTDPDAGHCVLIHGWGLGRDVWLKMITELRLCINVHCLSLPGFDESYAGDYSLPQLLAAIEKKLPEQCHLVGYSLGGLLAQSLLNSHKVKSVCSLSAGPSFIASEDWPYAMAKETFYKFVNHFEDDPSDCLRRFMGLQSLGDKQHRKLLLENVQLQKNSGVGSEYFADNVRKQAWHKALLLLAEIDSRELLKTTNKPVHFLLGEKDNLTPVSVIDGLKSLANANIRMTCLKAAHCLPLYLESQHEIGRWLERLIETEERKSCEHYHLDKSRIARSFSNAAASYDGVAGFQRQVCQQLLQNLSASDTNRGVLLDLGSGTGYLKRLLDACPRNEPNEQGRQLINLDLAEGMLRFAKADTAAKRNAQDRIDSVEHGCHWLAADAESLPLAPGSVDCLFSSLAIQWCQREDRLFQEIARVLKPGAHAYIATLGPNSLWQLRKAWASVDDNVHVNRFSSWSHLKQAVAGAGLSCTIEVEEISLGFDTFKDLRHDLKALGAQNMNSGQGVGLSGRQQINKLLQAYEAFRSTPEQGGQLALSYEVFYLKLTKPKPKPKPQAQVLAQY